MTSNPFVGTWRLLSWENRTLEGELSNPLGQDAAGYIGVSSRLVGEVAARRAAFGRRLRRLRRLRNFAEVAQNAIDAPPPSAEGCWLSRSAALQGGRRARHHRIQATAPPARGIRRRRQLHRRCGDRDRAVASPPACLLGVRSDRPPARDPRPPRQALAPP